MIAFKIHSARRTDGRDTAMLMENLDRDKVLIHLRRGKAEVLKKQLWKKLLVTIKIAEKIVLNFGFITVKCTLI